MGIIKFRQILFNMKKCKTEAARMKSFIDNFIVDKEHKVVKYKKDEKRVSLSGDEHTAFIRALNGVIGGVKSATAKGHKLSDYDKENNTIKMNGAVISLVVINQMLRIMKGMI